MFTILPEAFYEHDQLRQMGLDGDALDAARLAGELRAKDVKGSTFYKGAWLIEWLEKTPEVAHK